jgi:subtilisin family serine protease
MQILPFLLIRLNLIRTHRDSLQTRWMGGAGFSFVIACYNRGNRLWRPPMLRQLRLWIIAVACFAVMLVPVLLSQTSAKKKVTNQSDLPRFTYPLTGSASDLVQADAATFNAFAAKVKLDLDSIFRDYDIEDKATLRSLLSARVSVQQAAGENQLALQTLQSLLNLAGKPADNLDKKVVTKPELQAAIETNSTTGPAFEQAFRKYFRQALDALPEDLAQETARNVIAGSASFSSTSIIGGVKADFDPAIQKSGVLDNRQAWALVGVRNTLLVDLPLNAVVVEVLRQFVATHTSQQLDIWKARDVSFAPGQELTPVAVAIWDSGVDVSVFPDQLFNDPHPTASGNHGLAFDGAGNPSTSWLIPLTAAQQRQYQDFLILAKVMQDLRDGHDSPEARAILKEAGTLTSDQIRERDKLTDLFYHYAHGTHVAGIAARGNPAVRLVVARFDDDVTQLPFQPTPEWAHHLASDLLQMSDYFRTRNVRVVNMSWENDPREFEAWLSNTGAGTDPEERKRRAAEVYTIWRDAIEGAIRNAPNTLFVCVAGNSNHNAGFSQDVPASLHLPNLISVGAVNSAGKEANFTSYGDTVVIYANGVDVESYFPGGSRLKLSGTSMASPNVANLAAKLFALDPSLTPVQVIELIKKGATTSEDSRLHLIDPKASVALLKASK